MSITPEQCIAARDLLGWSKSMLAAKSRLVSTTVAGLEKGQMPAEQSLLKIRAALRAAGVIFTPENGDGPGVKLRKVK
jgi:hypothetical protein